LIRYFYNALGTFAPKIKVFSLMRSMVNKPEHADNVHFFLSQLPRRKG